jgi:hypothetical protein
MMEAGGFAGAVTANRDRSTSQYETRALALIDALKKLDLRWRAREPFGVRLRSLDRRLEGKRQK